MDMLKNLNCPQYVDFSEFISSSGDRIKSLEESQCSSKHYTESENYYLQDDVKSNLDSMMSVGHHLDDSNFNTSKNYSESENMESENENSYLQDALRSDHDISSVGPYLDDSNFHTSKEDMESTIANSMYEESDNSYLKDIKLSLERMSPLSYNNNSYQENVNMSTSATSGDFPVHRPIKVPENASKKRSKDNKCTKVQPFHFMESKKRKRYNSENECIPLAEQVVAFHKKTPKRFHTTGSKSFEPQEHWSPKRVIPQSPNLHAAKRMRGISKDILSREEQEQREAEEVKRYKFRARPLNEKVLNGCNLPKVSRKTPTKAQSFRLRTTQRAEVHGKKIKEEAPFEFHARPVPKAILSGPTGVKEKPSNPVTVAKSPNFALKSREAKWKSEQKLNTTSEEKKIKPLAVPDFSVPFEVKHEKKCTEIQPFSFESRNKAMIAKKEEKIKQEIEKQSKVFVFKAQPMPSPSRPPSLPAVERKTATIPEPFTFESRPISNRSNLNTSEQSCPVFKAQPAVVLQKPPFKPEKSTKPPVEIDEFVLHTDIRAVERQKLKEINDLKEKEKELLRQHEEKLREEEERREIEKLRKEQVHKAQPIRFYKPVEIKPSSKPPTEPVTPRFKTEERLLKRH